MGRVGATLFLLLVTIPAAAEQSGVVFSDDNANGERDPGEAPRQAIAVTNGRDVVVTGADGLMLEVHPAPEEVHSDGQQAIGLDEFGGLVDDAAALCSLDGRTLITPDGVLSADDSDPTILPSLRGTA